MTLYVFLALAVYASCCFATILLAGRSGATPLRKLYIAFFYLLLYVAYLIKCANTPPAVNAFIPLYKLFRLTEYGYASILRDLVSYALPFLPAGLLLTPAFPKRTALMAFMAGVMVSLALNLFLFVDGYRFVSDEYLFAGLGMATGAAIYAIAMRFASKWPFIKKSDLPVPSRRVFAVSSVYCVALYLGIALMMIVDYGETYAPIQFFESETKLPSKITLAFEPDASAGKARIYAPTKQSAYDRAFIVSRGLGMSGSVEASSGLYTVSDADAKLTFTESGSWTYEYTGECHGTAPAKDEAIAAVWKLFTENTLLTVSIDEVTDVVERHDTNGLNIGCDIYLSTSIDGHPIVGSCTLVVGVRRSCRIAKIRKYDGDLAIESERPIISQKAAYARLVSGDCAYTLFDAANSVSVDSCELGYMANSSQGYYLPVWIFHCAAALPDGSSVAFDAYVEALK